MRIKRISVISLIFILPLLTGAQVQANEQDKLKELKPEFRVKIEQLLSEARQLWPEDEEWGYKIVLAETYRTQERQDKLYAKGKSTTAVRVSMHTKRLAADIYFVRDGKILKYEDAPYLDLGEIAESLGLTWGGRWKMPFDPGHFELR